MWGATLVFLQLSGALSLRKEDGFIIGFLDRGIVEMMLAVSGFLIPNTIAADVSSHLEIP